MITIKDGQGNDLMITVDTDLKSRSVFSVFRADGSGRRRFFACRKADQEWWWLWGHTAAEFEKPAYRRSVRKVERDFTWKNLTHVAALVLAAPEF